MINGGPLYFGHADLCVTLYSVLLLSIRRVCQMASKTRDLMLWCAALSAEKDGCAGS